MSKSDIIKSLPNSEGKIDVNVPADWAKQVRELGIDPFWYVWDYRDNKVYGEPLNLMEEHLNQMMVEVKKLRSERDELIESNKNLLKYINNTI